MNTGSPTSRRRTQLASLMTLALLATAALAVRGPIAQWSSYHQFADARAWGLLPNALNVLSNLPFACIGLWAWPRLRNAGLAWRGVAGAVAATAVGSSIYHWQPTNLTLVIDRLPIAWACALLLCAFLSERVDTRWASAQAVGAAFVVATASVAWWAVGTASGSGDLRPYLLVQFLPMLLIPAALLMRMEVITATAVPPGAWWTALALYALAKALEVADASVLEALHLLSGHTLKHLVAAGAAAVLLSSRVSCGSRR